MIIKNIPPHTYLFLKLLHLRVYGVTPVYWCITPEHKNTPPRLHFSVNFIKTQKRYLFGLIRYIMTNNPLLRLFIHLSKSK